jgi:hypothetical protein
LDVASTTIFKWETLREVAAHVLRFKDPIQGWNLEVELTSGPTINVFRAHDREFYFCHGLTFGGKEAPGGIVSPFSGKDVSVILDNHYNIVSPRSSSLKGDILVWTGPNGETPHSAILLAPIITEDGKDLDYRSLLLSKNGRLPEATMILERLVDGSESYGETFQVYRRK